MICNNCGAELNDDCVFCSKCGYKTDTAFGNGINLNCKPTMHKMHKKNNKTIGILLLVLALITVASNIFFFNNKREINYSTTVDIVTDIELENTLNIDINQFAELSRQDIEDIFGEPIEVSTSSDNSYYVYNNDGFLYKFIFKHKKVTEIEISDVPYKDDVDIFNSLQIDDINKFEQVNDTGYAKKFVANSTKGDEIVKQVLIQGIDEENLMAEKIKISYK